MANPNSNSNAAPSVPRERARNPCIPHNVLIYGATSLLFIPIASSLVSILFARSGLLIAGAHLFLYQTGFGNILYNQTHFPQPPFVLFSSRVVTPEWGTGHAYVSVNMQGTIESVRQFPSWSFLRNRATIVDASPYVIMPGLVDPHTHINEPGRSSWEGFEHASRAAAAGGTTTILDMPLNNIPSTISHEAFAAKIDALISTKSVVDIGFIGGIIPNNVPALKELLDDGVLAFKSFMVDSQSVDFPNVSKKDLKKIISALERLFPEGGAISKPVPYILHAELDVGPAEQPLRKGSAIEYDHRSYDDYEASRPGSWEVEAIRYVADTANNSNVHVHIAHVSSFDAIRLLVALRSTKFFNKALLTAETCPHYLLWAKEEITTGATIFKCSPPIRSSNNRKLLLKHVFEADDKTRAIEVIASDHSPCPPELKSSEGNMTSSWGGISGLQYRLQGTWTTAREMNSTFTQVADLLSGGPARIFGIDNMKGSLKAGLDADIVIWDPDSSQLLTEDHCYHRHKPSPYHGLTMHGIVLRTLLRGRTIYSLHGGSRSNKATFGEALGKLLFRSSRTGVTRSIPPNEWNTARLRK